MKKTFLFAALAAFSMISCTNNELPEAEVGYGYINLNVTNEVEVTTRGAVGADELASWTAVVKKATNEKYNSNANTLSSHSFEVGTDYSLSVYNYVDDVAAHASTVNEGWGAARYFGETTNNFAVTQGKSTNVTVACGKAKNTRIGVTFNSTFTEAVASGYTLIVSADNRSQAFDANTPTTKYAYYPTDKTVSYSLSYTFNGQDKTASGTINTGADGGVQHTLNVTLNSNGSISLSISYEDFTIANPKDVVIDGGTGDDVTPQS